VWKVTRILGNISNPRAFFVKPHDEKTKIENTISKIKTNGDEEDVKKLERQLARVTAAGGLESIVPTEGITFVYKGKLYKYTGIFAPLHQIRSILAYKK
jgi:hypothetical protein